MRRPFGVRIALRSAALVVAAACGDATAASDAAQRATARGAASATSTTKDTDTRSLSTTPDGTVSRTRVRTAVEFHSAAELDQIASQLAKGTTTAQTVGAHPTHHIVEARRRTSGEPEIHDRWVDVTVVQAGHAMLLTGGRVAGDHLSSAGEHRGGAIQGGTARAIAAGDLFVIPAGTPHQYVLAGDDSVRYLTIKVRQP